MAELRRRTFLSGSALAAASFVGAGALANPAPARAEGLTEADCEQIQKYGYASITASIAGMCVIGDKVYTASRGQTPPLIGEIDIKTRKLLRKFTLERGEGAWATTESGGKLYVGSYPDADFYEFDPETAELTRITTMGPFGTLIWCLTTAPDGVVYAGTGPPRGEVWEYNPATKQVRNFRNIVPGQQIVRGIAADDKYVYAGSLAIGYLTRIDRVTGEKVNIAPVPNPAGIGVCLKAGDRVLAGAGPTVFDVRPDGSDAHLVRMQDRLVDMLAVNPRDGVLYATGRSSGSVLKRVGDQLIPIATPAPLDEHRGLFFVDEGRTALGGAGNGELWWLDMDTRESTTLDLVNAGLAGPESVQSITLGPDKTVYVGGQSCIMIHQPSLGFRRRVKIQGEPKKLLLVKDRLYAAMYPRAEVYEIEVRGGRHKSLGLMRNDLTRPLDMRYHEESNQLLVGMAPINGKLDGALVFVEPRRGNVEVLKGVIPYQSVTSIAIDGDIAYLSGDCAGGGGTPMVRKTAAIAAFDLRTRQVLWEAEPIPNASRLVHITYLDGLIYGVYRLPGQQWMVFDPATRTVLRSGPLQTYGEVYKHRGKVYATQYGIPPLPGEILQIGPDLAQPKVIATNLGDGFYNAPQLAFEPDSDHAWALQDLELARINLDPACAPAIQGRSVADPPPAEAYDWREVMGQPG